MYKLESILPEDEFYDIISEFSIGSAQRWLDRVREVLGFSLYEDIKKEFKETEAVSRQERSEMNCFVKRKACENRETVFQIDIGADKNVRVDGEGVDNLFTSFFVGV